MRIRAITTMSVATALALSVAAPAGAGQQAATFTIDLEFDSRHPGETTGVTGDSSGPACAQDGADVTLSYTKPNGSTGTVTVSVVTDANGDFSTSITVPDDAVAGEAASVTAVIADCTDDNGSTRTATPADLTIEAYDGEFTSDKDTGKPGTTVHLSGTNCWGGAVEVVFTDGDIAEPVDVTLKADKTFSGTYTIPDAPSGEYAFAAQCPGTDYDVLPFVLVNPQASPTTPVPTASPTAPRPITGPVRFTG